MFPPDMPAILRDAELPRGALRHILAQFEAALKRWSLNGCPVHFQH